MNDHLLRFPSPQKRRVGALSGPTRRIMHVDMDAFFAAVEQADNPHLQDRPVVVGGSHGGRGVVSTASYESRAYGIHSGMPANEARRLCPDAVFVGVNARQYIDISHRLREIFAEFSPTVEAVSVDEAFLDITGCSGLFGGEESLARGLKKRIRDEVSLSCSVGIAPGKIMAKLASSVFKPDGLTIVHPDDIARVFFHMPVGKLWGVGPVTARSLHVSGINTIGDLARIDLDDLRRRAGHQAEILGRIARGEDVSPVIGTADRPTEKSIGHERTFSTDSTSREFLEATLRELSDRVARRMRQAKLRGRTVTVKIRLADFETCTRRITLPGVTDDSGRIAQLTVDLLTRHYDGREPVRLLGVTVSSLFPIADPKRVPVEGQQQQLFPTGTLEPPQPSQKEQVIDAIRDRFGEKAIVGGFHDIGVGW